MTIEISSQLRSDKPNISVDTKRNKNIVESLEVINCFIIQLMNNYPKEKKIYLTLSNSEENTIRFVNYSKQYRFFVGIYPTHAITGEQQTFGHDIQKKYTKMSNLFNI